MMVLLPKQIPISTDFSKHLLPLMANNINACIIISIIHPLQPSLLFQRHLVVFEILDCIGFVGNSWHCIKLWEHIRYTEFNNWILNLNKEQMTDGRVICLRRGTLRAFSFRIFFRFRVIKKWLHISENKEIKWSFSKLNVWHILLYFFRTWKKRIVMLPSTIWLRRCSREV